jgi:REP element-mobilizing transposase RayT
VDNEIRLNALGEIVRVEWFRSAKIRAEIELHPNEFVVMPNHIHGNIVINVGAYSVAALKTPSHTVFAALPSV